MYVGLLRCIVCVTLSASFCLALCYTYCVCVYVPFGAVCVIENDDCVVWINALLTRLLDRPVYRRALIEGFVRATVFSGEALAVLTCVLLAGGWSLAVDWLLRRP